MIYMTWNSAFKIPIFKLGDIHGYIRKPPRWSTTTQDKSQGNHFERKMNCVGWDVSPQPLILGRCLYLLSYQGSSAGWVETNTYNVQVNQQRKNNNFPTKCEYNLSPSYISCSVCMLTLISLWHSQIPHVQVPRVLPEHTWLSRPVLWSQNKHTHNKPLPNTTCICVYVGIWTCHM